MKHVKITALALALTSVAAGSAMAQSKANAWEGAYGQVSVGYAMFNPSVGQGTGTQPTGLPAPYPSSIGVTATGSNLNNISTGTANLAAGYNFGINSDYVLGVGATYYPGASSSATGTFSFATAHGGIPLGSTVGSYIVINLYDIFLSPGYVIDKDRLAYFKVGYTGATIGLSSPIVAYNSTNLTGYTLGLGYKQMVTSSIYILGEVNYASYGNSNASATTSTGASLSVPLKGTGTDFLVGVGYRF